MMLFPLIIANMPEGEDRDYMEWLYIEYSKHMYRRALLISRNRTLAEDVVDEAVGYAEEKTERTLERISNEKIMAVGEYSDTVLEEINKNHKEVMFLYDMLNDKQSGLNETIKKAEEVSEKASKTSDELAKKTEELVKAAETLSVSLSLLSRHLKRKNPRSLLKIFQSR